MHFGILDDGNFATVLAANPAQSRRKGELPRAGFEAMDEFLSSCGADGPLRLDVTGPGPRQAVRCVFEQPCVMIGRDLGNDLRLDHDQVSRRHAYLQILAGRTFCVDLGSRTGLWWGKRTRNCGWLEWPMYIGSYRLQRADRAAAPLHPGQEWNPLETPAPDQRALPRVTLEIFDAAQPTVHTIDRVLSLAGRSTACKVQIASFSLSRFHCSFLLTASGLWVVDLLSREGTFVNGRRVKWACLRPGDQVQLGKILVRPNYDGPAPEGPAVFALANGGDQFHSPPASDPELPDLSSVRSRADDREAARSLVSMPTPPQPLAPTEPSPLPPIDAKALEAAGPQGALLLPVLQQFGVMQQQMMDQFQQSMQMVVQVFASMHRDQMETLQKELDHVHRITRELNELQSELRNSPRSPIRSRNGSLTRPAAATPSAVSAAAAATPQAPPAATSPAAGPPPGEGTVPGPTPSVPPGGPMPDMGDMHDWLNQRIVTLQKERESSWQKILGFVMGK